MAMEPVMTQSPCHQGLVMRTAGYRWWDPGRGGPGFAMIAIFDLMTSMQASWNGQVNGCVGQAVI